MTCRKLLIKLVRCVKRDLQMCQSKTKPEHKIDGDELLECITGKRGLPKSCEQFRKTSLIRVVAVGDFDGFVMTVTVISMLDPILILVEVGKCHERGHGCEILPTKIGVVLAVS
jgi:hypothetical protein